MKLIKAIITANGLKDTRLNVINHGSFHSYYWKKDLHYTKYANAMSTISQHRIIATTLKKLGII